MKKAVKTAVIWSICLTLLVNLGLSLTLTTDKNVYYCDPTGKCEPVKITINNTASITGATVKLTYDGNAGKILTAKLPYSVVSSANAYTVSNLNIPSGVFKFTWNTTARLNKTMKFNLTVYDKNGNILAQLDPFYASDCGYKRQINISKVYPPVDLFNFTVLVVLNETNYNYTLSNASTDVRFYSSLGVLLPKDSNYSETGGNSYFWVRIPYINASAEVGGLVNYFEYYYNCSTANEDDPTTVWYDYAGVYHLDANYNNSRGNFSTGVNQGSSQVAGVVAGGAEFDNFDMINTTEGIPLKSGLTITLWLNKSMYTSDPAGLVYKSNSVDWTFKGYAVWIPDPNHVNFRLNDKYTSANFAFQDSAFHYVVVTWNSSNTTMKTYGDGAELAYDRTDYLDTDVLDVVDVTWIGRYYSADYSYEGIIDEVRIINGSRSDGWINASFQSERNTLLLYGGEERNETEQNETGNESERPPLDLNYSGSVAIPCSTCWSYRACLTNVTAYHEKNYTFNNKSYSFQETVDCPYGCSNGDCNADVYTSYLNVFYLFIAILGAFIMILIINRFRIR